MNKDEEINEAIRNAQIDILEWLMAHASGGGSWRRLIIMKIAELKKDEVD